MKKCGLGVYVKTGARLVKNKEFSLLCNGTRNAALLEFAA